VPEKQRHQLWAEAIRDVGILFLVFAPLETLLRHEDRTWIDWLMAGAIALGGLLLIEKGVRMESDT
jgi:hypothetical protein